MMKLTIEKIREMLLEIEAKPDMSLTEVTDENKKAICLLLSEEGYVNLMAKETQGGSYIVFIRSLTWKGHELLDTIRDPDIFAEARARLGEHFSIDMFYDVCKKIIIRKLELDRI